jgi:hypothetical protein
MAGGATILAQSFRGEEDEDVPGENVGRDAGPFGPAGVNYVLVIHPNGSWVMGSGVDFPPPSTPVVAGGLFYRSDLTAFYSADGIGGWVAI